MTQDFVPVVRRLPPAVPTADIMVEAPPDLPSPTSPSLLPRLLPVVMSVASMGVMAAAFVSGSTVTRSPMFLAFPMMMLVSTVVTLTGGARRQGGGIDADRVDYLGYLSRLREIVSETAAAQCFSLNWSHPEPDTLWTLIGGPRMWERRAADPDFCLVRVGVGTQPLATRLVAPQTPSWPLSDPVTAAALRRFIHTHSTIADAPIALGLRGIAIVTIDGDVTLARGLLRAMICQLAVLHPPDQLLIVGAISDRNRAHWDWLKWLPHNQHPAAADAVGSVRMVYASPAEAQHALAGARLPHAVVVADLDERADEIAGATVVQVVSGCDGAPLTLSQPGEAQALLCPDQMDPIDALICARRLARYRVGVPPAEGGPGWPSLVGLGDVGPFRPDQAVAQPRLRRPTLRSHRNHGRRFTARAGYQRARRKRYGPARALRRCHWVGQVGAAAHHRARHDGAELSRSAQSASHRFQRGRNVSRFRPRSARGRGHHQPVRRSTVGGPDARSAGRRDEPPPTAAAHSRLCQRRGIRTCAPGRCPLDRPTHLVHHRRRVFRNAEPASRFHRHVCRHRPARPVAGYAPATGQPAARRGPAAGTGGPSVLSGVPEDSVCRRITHGSGNTRRIPTAEYARRGFPAYQRQ